MQNTSISQFPGRGRFIVCLLGLLLLSPAAFAAVPTAIDDGPFFAPEGGSVVGSPNVLTNDTDAPENDPMSAVLVAGPANAVSFSLNADGSFTYVHDGSETSSDSFTYTANDLEGPSNVATVTLIVTALNDQPVVIGQNPVSTPEETLVLLSLGNLLVSDPDNNYPGDFSLSILNGSNYTHFFNFITPVADFDGDLTVLVTVTDNSGAGNATSDVFNLIVTVTNVNDRPVITGQSALSTPEETALLISLTDLVVTDVDNEYPDDFTLAVQSGSDYTLAGNTITPVANFNGALTVPVTVTDNSGAGNATSFAFNLSVNVSPINDQPVIIGQNAVSTPEETARTIVLTDLLVTDDDNSFPADFTLTVQSGSNYTLAGNTITPAVDFNGNLTVPVTVTDNSGEANATSAVFNLTVSVSAVNDQPVITSQSGALSTLQDTAVLLTLADLTVTDVDNTYPADFTLAAQDGANYTRVGNTITPIGGFIGSLAVPVTVTDNSGAGNATSGVFNLTVSVFIPNVQPVISGQMALSTPEETALVIALTDLVVTDPDNTFPADFTHALQDGSNYTRAGNTITPVADFNGNLTVPVTVTDNSGEVNATSAVFNLTVAVNAVNDRPVITGQSALSTPEETALTVLLTDLSVSDPDNVFPADFTLVAQDGANYTRVDNTITPADEFGGDLMVSLTVADNSGAGNATSTVFNLIISVAAVNDRPVITGQSPLTTAEDTALTITLADLSATDSDNSFPADFTLTVQEGTNYTRTGNTITPVADFNGALVVPATVTDNSGEANATSAVFNLTVSVSAVNDQSVIIGQNALSTQEEEALTLLLTDLIVTDPDNNFPADFTLQVQDGSNYTRAGNTITPVDEFNGDLSVPVTVTDNSGEGNAISTVFDLVISVSAVNDNPEIESPIINQIAIEGSEFSLSIFANFSDADNDPLEFTATGLPASGNLTLDSVNGVLSGTPQFDDARDNDPYLVVITATDNRPGSTPAQAEFELIVSALDRANVALDISVAPDPAMLNDELNWTLTASNAVGPQMATNVSLTGSFVGAALTVSTSSSCTIQAAVENVSSFDCALGGLPVGGSATVVFTTTTSAPGDVLIFASALSTDAVPIDPNIDDNDMQIAVGVAESFSNGAVQVLGNAEIRSIAAGDFDGDDATDLIAGTPAGQPIQIYLSSGFRDFSGTAIALADLAANEGIATADFDRNGTLDIVVANGGGLEDAVYSNDGTGFFTPMAVLGPSFGQDVAVGDFDGDGIIDIVLATAEGNPVYLGDGFGSFSLHATLGAANSRSVAVAQLDNDGLDDIVFANSAGGDSQVWLNDSGSGFTQGDSLGIGDAASVTTGEFGGDLRPDLAFGRVSSGNGDVPSNPVLINEGNGGFGVPIALLGASSTGEILAGDINRDGLDDLVFINVSGVHQIWIATGAGFELHGEQIVDADSTTGILGDLGMVEVGDAGGVDLALGGAVLSGVGIFLNDGFGNLGFGDAVSPVLSLVGNAAIDVPSGSAYSESGATAQDNIDGDISASVVVSGVVNTAVVGSYVVNYNVADSAGNNAAPITRTVNITPAAGTGGGGGGTTGSLALLWLFLAALLTTQQARCAIISANSKLRSLMKAANQ